MQSMIHENNNHFAKVQFAKIIDSIPQKRADRWPLYKIIWIFIKVVIAF